MTDQIEQFNAYRKKMNERLLATDNRVIKRMFSLDSLAYMEGGALDVKSRELMGLVASLVLRCDDCVRYHIGRALEVGASAEEIIETMSVGLVVGGTIVIPHLRRAVEFLDQAAGHEGA
ncbi:MAG: carboxymuconolactone decarboxylase family protein [Wenzhouxiangellaceae bacterium]